MCIQKRSSFRIRTLPLPNYFMTLCYHPVLQIVYVYVHANYSTESSFLFSSCRLSAGLRSYLVAQTYVGWSSRLGPNYRKFPPPAPPCRDMSDKRSANMTPLRRPLYTACHRFLTNCYNQFSYISARYTSLPFRSKHCTNILCNKLQEYEYDNIQIF